MAKDYFNFVDLFAGIGGFHQALRFYGGKCVLASEIDEDCLVTYITNYKSSNGVVRGDINEIDPKSIKEFDVLCAGFPCQPFSKAGLQKGFQDKERGNFFYKLMDILDSHKEVKFVILENVRNLADKTENWGVITKELKSRGFIITEEPLILSPTYFGIPQFRERVYILGMREDIRNDNVFKNGHIRISDLNLDKEYKKCRLKSAWKVLEKNVHDDYIVTSEEELVINAWDEFRVNTGLKTVGFPIWLDSFGLHVKDLLETTEKNVKNHDDNSVSNSESVQEYFDTVLNRKEEEKHVGSPRIYSIPITPLHSKEVIVQWATGTADYWIDYSEDSEGATYVIVNIEHPFFLPYSKDEKFKIVLEKFVLAFVMAEYHAQQASDKEGYILADAYRNNMNRYLEKMSKE